VNWRFAIPLSEISETPEAFAKKFKRMAVGCESYDPEDFISIKTFSKGVRLS
jgi:hypothetical protein